MIEKRKQAERMLAIFERIDPKRMPEDKRETFLLKVESMFDWFDPTHIPDSVLEVLLKDCIIEQIAKSN